jgi:hypothetical protein
MEGKAQSEFLQIPGREIWMKTRTLKKITREAPKNSVEYRKNAKLASALWGELSIVASKRLHELTNEHKLSIAAGDLQLLGGVWYITHAGLLGIAWRRRCSGIGTTLVDRRSEPPLNR